MEKNAVPDTPAAEEDLRIRRGEPSDLPEVKEMYAALVARMDREGWGVWDETYPRDFVGKDMEQGQFYLLLKGGRLAGAFALPARDNGEGDVPWEDPAAPARYLYRFGVAVEYGGQGLGKRALGLIGGLAESLGARYLRLYVAHENAPAIGLYERAGFRRVPGEFGEFLPDGSRLFEYAFEKRL